MKKILFLFILFFCSTTVVNAEETLAKAIYSNPIIDGSGKYDTYMIEFRGIHTPDKTYWALCNWGMDLTNFKKNHYDVKGGGAYAGLQVSNGDRKAIMSFWEVKYKNSPNGETKSHRATMVYPYLPTDSFAGEGEGSKYITKFNWRTNSWYRMLIHSWKDYETGNTFVGQWFLDVENNKWYLISYFDTKLKDSYMIGSLGLFQENFNTKTNGQLRDFNFRGMYARNYGTNTWVSINKTVMSYDTKEMKFKTSGTHNYKSSPSSFYASAGEKLNGITQDEYDKQHPANVTLSITQNPNPPIKSVTPTIKAVQNGNRVIVTWTYNNPQKGYELKVINADTNKVITTVKQTRPEVKKVSFNAGKVKNYRFELKVYSVFKTEETVYAKISVDDLTPINDEKSNEGNKKESNTTSNKVSNNSSNAKSNSSSNNTASNNTSSNNTNNNASNTSNNNTSNTTNNSNTVSNVTSNSNSNTNKEKDNKEDNSILIFGGIGIVIMLGLIGITLKKSYKKNL